MDVLTKTCFLSLFVGQVLAYSQLVHPKAIAEGSSTIGNYVTSRAVDGNTDQDVSRCFHSGIRRDITEAWLRIDLGGVFSVKSVKFWYRDDRGSAYYNTLRLRGYSLRVSNDTSVLPPESSCYNDPENVTLPTIIEKDCERTARYIWIYQSNKPYGEPCPMLEICEVQVFGCEVGYYGRNCTNKCDHCKNSVTCGVQNGECDALGCINDGYQPLLCKECKRGRYGLNCIKQCSQFCIDDDCQKNEGTCIKGCERGYRGNLCNETCQKQWYGLNCSETCGNCLKDPICHHVTGTCLEGCAAGYKTQTCKTPCLNGTFVLNCQYNCSGNCLDEEPCNSTDGTCTSCSPGWDTVWCNKTCDAAWYGAGCKFQCGYCFGEDNCHHVNGSSLFGCQKGFTGDLCFNPCSAGRYGQNCGYTCSGNCENGEACDKTNGSCRSCNDGFQGIKCDRVEGGAVFEGLTSLKTLDLSGNFINHIPPDLLKHQSNLEELILSLNDLEVWTLDIKHMSKLKFINCSYNRLVSLPESLQSNLDAIAEDHGICIAINNNKVLCNCENLQFISWMIKTDVKLSMGSKRCTKSDGSLIDIWEAYHILKTNCGKTEWVFATVPSLMVFCFAFVLGFLLYRKRWTITYHWYLFRLRHKGYTPIAGENDEHEYDAFLSFAEEDKNFVYKIVGELENCPDERYELCFHHRDFTPGVSIERNIVSAIHSSRKTIIFMSNSYVKSSWCNYELRMSITKEGQTNRRVIVMVILDSIPRKKLPLEVMQYYKKNCYIEKPDKDNDLTVFIKTLKESLKN